MTGWKNEPMPRTPDECIARARRCAQDAELVEGQSRTAASYLVAKSTAYSTLALAMAATARP